MQGLYRADRGVRRPPDAGDARRRRARTDRAALPLTARPAAAARFARDLAAVCGGAADGGVVLAAVSGGADSLALLLLLHDRMGPRARAATVDHGLRPESAGEAAHVASVCAGLGVPHATLRGDLPARTGRTANLSSRARTLRYALLREHAATVGAHWTATAHHADDQAETLVMRLNRGAGVGGLAGIRAARGGIVRPLLAWRRAELAAVVADAGIVPVDDPSNRDPRFDRARVRAALAGSDLLDPARLAESAAHLRAADDALDWCAADWLARLGRLDAGGAEVAASDLPFELHRRIVTACVRHVDPAAALRGPALAALTHGLRAGTGGMLGEVVCSARPDGVWRFRRAPPRGAC